jgi:hypothetical protein
VWRRTEPVGGKIIWACSHPWNGIRDGGINGRIVGHKKLQGLK